MSWAEIRAAAARIVTEAARAGAGARAGAAGAATVSATRISGIAWATVEADRAFRELDGALGAATSWVPQERDGLLGASVWRRNPSPGDGGGALFVVEPDTEGRLAANLARFGEGVAAVYVGGRGEADRIMPVSARWGPYVIVRSRSG
ncbi:MAG TPA: hypothetical protein VFI15_06875 [Candidatus Limnocylindrales bacterium]|nr:hypothetical protein [Candidatus Limnocylindrales bacterium]